MELIEQRLSDMIEKTPFTREKTEGRLDDHFTQNSALGAVQRKDYQGYFFDQFGVDYHVFGVTVTGNDTGIDWWGAIVTRKMVDLSQQNSNLYQSTLEFAMQLIMVC